MMQELNVVVRQGVIFAVLDHLILLDKEEKMMSFLCVYIFSCIRRAALREIVPGISLVLSRETI